MSCQETFKTPRSRTALQALLINSILLQLAWRWGVDVIKTVAIFFHPRRQSLCFKLHVLCICGQRLDLRLFNPEVEKSSLYFSQVLFRKYQGHGGGQCGWLPRNSKIWNWTSGIPGVLGSLGDLSGILGKLGRSMSRCLIIPIASLRQGKLGMTWGHAKAVKPGRKYPLRW